MSRSSVKDARRPAKAARRTVKKGAKSARSSVKKASKNARRSVGKTQRQSRSVAVRSPSVAPKAGSNMTASKTASKTAKMIRTQSPPMQPVAAPDLPVRAHKYQIGEAVYYTSPTFGRAAAIGSYTVVKLLPSESDDYQYRIKSSGEAFERVAKESQLDRA
jgi:hypothetical protein